VDRALGIALVVLGAIVAAGFADLIYQILT
jgi:hypothetical protein